MRRGSLRVFGREKPGADPSDEAIPPTEEEQEEIAKKHRRIMRLKTGGVKRHARKSEESDSTPPKSEDNVRKTPRKQGKMLVKTESSKGKAAAKEARRPRGNNPLFVASEPIEKKIDTAELISVRATLADMRTLDFLDSNRNAIPVRPHVPPPEPLTIPEEAPVLRKSPQESKHVKQTRFQFAEAREGETAVAKDKCRSPRDRRSPRTPRGRTAAA